MTDLAVFMWVLQVILVELEFGDFVFYFFKFRVPKSKSLDRIKLI